MNEAGALSPSSQYQYTSGRDQVPSGGAYTNIFRRNFYNIYTGSGDGGYFLKVMATGSGSYTVLSPVRMPGRVTIPGHPDVRYGWWAIHIDRAPGRHFC